MLNTNYVPVKRLEYSAKNNYTDVALAMKAMFKRVSEIPVRPGLADFGDGMEVQLNELITRTTQDVDWDWRTGETAEIVSEYTERIPVVFRFASLGDRRKWVERGRLDLHASCSPRPEEWRFDDGDSLKITALESGRCLFAFYSKGADKPYHEVEFGIFQSFEPEWVVELVRRYAGVLFEISPAALPRQLSKYGNPKAKPPAIRPFNKPEIVEELKKLADPYAEQRAAKRSLKEQKRQQAAANSEAKTTLLEQLKNKYR